MAVTMPTRLLTGLFTAAACLSVAGIANAQPAARSVPTFSKDVAPIFFANCTGCHRPGEGAPMSLMTYKDARPWARSIATRVRGGVMPPWHADPSIGHFSNERRLTEEQKTTVVRWAEGGAPEGNPNDLPPAPKYIDGWNIGTPDAVLTMQEDYPIPATGEVPYVYFEVPANYDEDRWLQAWELRPGNASVVHHVIVYVRPPQSPGAALLTALMRTGAGAPPAGAAAVGAAQPGGAQAGGAAAPPRPRGVLTLADGMEIPDGQTGGRPLPPELRKTYPNYRPRPSGTQGSIGGYVPGNSTRVYPAGTAMRLPKGASLVFQMHYTPNGKATTDRSRIGLIFAKQTPTMPLSTASLVNGSLRIPPGAKDHRVDAEMTLNRDLVVFSLTPHTHVRGTKWYYEAIYPDGRREPFLSVPKYDFNWQTDYVFSEPMRLPAGTVVRASAWYDNSTGNKSNPDATKEVLWGDQTWEEMMFTSFTFHAVPAPTARQ
jgi:hypothetical protein